MSITAMKQALEALEGCRIDYDYQGNPMDISDIDVLNAITSLRQAIEEAEKQEPVPWQGCDLDGMVEAFDRVIEAHFFRKNPFHNPIDADAQMALRILRGFIPYMKQYTTTQPQREWVGLTQQDIDIAFDDTQEGGGFNEFAEAIEQILRRKNT